MRVERHVRPEIDAEVVDVGRREEVARGRQGKTGDGRVDQETVHQSGRVIK